MCLFKCHSIGSVKRKFQLFCGERRRRLHLSAISIGLYFIDTHGYYACYLSIVHLNGQGYLSSLWRKSHMFYSAGSMNKLCSTVAIRFSFVMIFGKWIETTRYKWVGDWYTHHLLGSQTFSSQTNRWIFQCCFNPLSSLRFQIRRHIELFSTNGNKWTENNGIALHTYISPISNTIIHYNVSINIMEVGLRQHT